MFGDGKGPMGRGEKTGRRFGYCNGFDSPGCMNERYGSDGYGLRRRNSCGRGSDFGRGFKAGFAKESKSGMGFARTRDLNNEYTSENEILRIRKESLEKQLRDIDSKLKELEK
ncbi:DUF5320 domain-containing protein [uncultured Ilyobacter sp.]|uniref:DUF5320 domain-containing protein n=1 Tax=uncultured Ilyobacter sp. TaxID=544433 RepID=UPI0029C88D2C|nr:DUF5320 domain-containing protein [uncultured Ilyobacter sp.]